MLCQLKRVSDWTMKGDRLSEMLIRELHKDDLETRVRWMNNPKVYQSMHFEVPVLMENTINWYEKNRINANRIDVTFQEQERIVAFGGLTSMKLGRAELYVFVDPDSQQKGIGSEATRLLCKWGFSNLGLRKIYLYTNEDNVSAIRVYEKCGFKLEGCLRQEYLSENGEYKNRLYFGLLATEFDD